MASFFVAEQRSACRIAYVNAQLTSTSSDPIFTLSVDGVSAVSHTYDRTDSILNAVQSYMLTPNLNNGPAIGTVFQVTAQNAIIKDVQFSVEPLINFSQKVLFHGLKVNYINSPSPLFFVDGSQVTPTNLADLTDSQGKPKSAVLYFPALTTGYVLHMANNPKPTLTTYSVANLIMSYSPLASSIDE